MSDRCTCVDIILCEEDTFLNLRAVYDGRKPHKLQQWCFPDLDERFGEVSRCDIAALIASHLGC